MIFRTFLLFAAVLVLTSCGPLAPPPEAVDISTRPVSFLDEVKPVLDARCASCHSCYNAACQLKLSSFDGLDRGGSKIPVYATRLTDQAPTRLFVDAQSTAQWRDRKFYSVTQSEGQKAEDKSIMRYFLDAKRRDPVPDGTYRAETDLTCAADVRETRRFLGKHPGRGMPFGFPALTPVEEATLASWLEQGAQGPSEAEQAALSAPTPAAAEQVRKWESFLNRGDAKHALTARYLYEHFFLAHLRLSEAPENEFFRLVRSSTPPGQPISVIATVRPYDDPGTENFYYRFEKIYSTLVYKTHIVVELDDRRLARYQELFIDTAWLEPPHSMPFDDKSGANPFLIYAQIPPKSRYQFMLDHSEYIIRSFIRGPVCKGQIAVGVIHDHFWVLFLDPEADQAVLHPEFLIHQADNLRLPTERGSDEKLLATLSDAYRDRYARFYAAKNILYDETAPQGVDLQAIWPGNDASDSPLLTIYRHFDSASVHKGALGDLPKTLWVIDYPQFERIYYSLVAGFDVFGNISHQANVRRYMDYLRAEGELNFLSFLPAPARKGIFRSWYIGDGAVEDTRIDRVVTQRPSRVIFSSDDPKREFVENVIANQLSPETGISLDPVNYHASGEVVEMPASFSTLQDLVDGFRSLNEPGVGFIRHITDTDVNVIFVRIRNYQGSDRFFSIVVNRWHDNVNSLYGEKKRLNPKKDTMDFIPGHVGSYPNYFVDVDATEVAGFFDVVRNFDGSPEYIAKLNEYGVNRSDPKFWQTYDWFQQQLDEGDPLNAGLFDLNRYYPEAFAE